MKNTPENERVAWRSVLHCAPLKTQGYVSHFVRNDVKWVGYHYGTYNPLFEPDGHISSNVPNLTFIVNDLDSQYRHDKKGSSIFSNFVLQ